ncbi:hypothetical protein NIA69_16365 [Gemmiger formicilis]|nr:hypothetical protein [Gemmiger formicilis]
MLFCAHGSRGLLPPGRTPSAKNTQKYYNELGIPQAERPLLPLLADGSEVLWLWGCGFAEGCAPMSTPTRY